MNGLDDSDDEESNFISWGCGEFGQHGHGVKEDVTIEDGLLDRFCNKENSQVVMAACGASHVILLTKDNKLFGWGNGNSGQLGTSSTETNWQPKAIHLLDDQTPNPPIAGIACGGRHTMIWLTNGNVFSFGNNFFAQLGYDFKEDNYKENQTTPHLLKFLVYRPVVQVSCGEKHSVFRFQEGTVACVGCNTHGQIGSDNREEAVVPRFIDLDHPIKSIASGANHNLAITDEGHVYQWGYGRSCGEKNRHLLSPVLVDTLHNIVQVAGGAHHSMALSDTGCVYVWGSGNDGQLGLGDQVLFQSTPKRVKNLQNIIKYIAAGESYSAAITENGKLYMWGKNSHCILPNQPTALKVWTPVCINTGLRTVKTISCGSWHAVSLTGIPDPVGTSFEHFHRMVDVNKMNKQQNGDDTSEESEDDFKERLPNIAPKQTALDGEVVFSRAVEYPEELLRNGHMKSPSISSEEQWQQKVLEKQEIDKSRLVIQMPSEEKPQFIDASTSPIPFSSSESESDGALHSCLKNEDEIFNKTSNSPSQKSASRYPLFFDRQKTNALKEQPSSVVQVSKTNAEHFILPRENTNFSCKQIDLTELEVIKTIHDLKSQEKIVRANLINETGETFIESPVSRLSTDSRLRGKLFTRSSEKSSVNLEDGRYIDSPMHKSGRYSDTAILNLAMRDRVSFPKPHRTIESALSDYYSIDDGRWPNRQTNSIPKKTDVNFGLKISRSDTIIGPIKSQMKNQNTNHIQRYSNVHNPINLQKSTENKNRIRIPVPRQVSIPVGRDKQEKINNLRVDGMTRKRLLYSSASSWRDRDQDTVLDVPKNSYKSVSPLGTHESLKSSVVNGQGNSLLNGHTKNNSMHSKTTLQLKGRSKTCATKPFNLEHFETAMDFDSDLKNGSQNFSHNTEEQPVTSVSQMS